MLSWEKGDIFLTTEQAKRLVAGVEQCLEFNRQDDIVDDEEEQPALSEILAKHWQPREGTESLGPGPNKKEEKPKSFEDKILDALGF